jgi:hypothetical protein
MLVKDAISKNTRHRGTEENQSAADERRVAQRQTKALEHAILPTFR